MPNLSLTCTKYLIYVRIRTGMGHYIDRFVDTQKKKKKNKQAKYQG